MQIIIELDNEHVDKLHALEKRFNKNTSELIAFIIDEVFSGYSAITDEQNADTLIKQSSSD
jgi:tRNA(Ile)-lysidine synthase TilS/MesJ